MLKEFVQPLGNISSRTENLQGLMNEDHFGRFQFVGSRLIEEQDIVDHNWSEELQMNGHLKNG